MLIHSTGIDEWLYKGVTRLDSGIKDPSDKNVWQVVEDLIECAPNLRINYRYRMVESYPIAKASSGQGLFPALAIPVKTKFSFECPAEHLDTLRKFLPRLKRSC